MTESTSDYVRGAFGEAVEEGQDPQEALDEYPLSVEKEVHLVVTVSTGGPHEEIDAVISGGEVQRATFGAYWGGELVETQLSESDALWQWASSLADLIAEEG